MPHSPSSPAGLVRVITSCTGLKVARTDKGPLTAEPLSLDELRQSHGDGAASPPPRVESIGWSQARHLYAGQQHERLMRGVDHLGFRKTAGETVTPPDLWVLSAGVGLVHQSADVPPYEATFSDMSKASLRSWATDLNVPQATAGVLAEPAALQLVLLGDSYWDAVDLQADLALGGPTFLFCGSVKERTLPVPDRAKVVVLRRETARAFSCGLVGLKGELAARLLVWIYAVPRDAEARVASLAHADFSGDDLLALLLAQPATETLARQSYHRDDQFTLFPSHVSIEDDPEDDGRVLAHEQATETVDYETPIDLDWRAQSASRQIQYFIPDWDDMVDPGYDFLADAHTPGKRGWMRDVYAHQLYQPKPNYDGVLVSRSVLERRTTADKRAFLYRYGIHDYLRLPSDILVLGDCGAFSYKDEAEPPFSTADVLTYYTRLGFDLGVSVDHLAVVADDPSERLRRQRITVANAREFIRQHTMSGLEWEPVGAVQGWDPESYARAAAETVQMGYGRIAIGGVVQTRTADIIAILEAVHAAIQHLTPYPVGVHILGVARIEATADFVRLGVTSVDSASPLRKAWTDARKNYFTLDGRYYAAVRVPAPQAATLAHGVDMDGARRLEQETLASLRALDASDDQPSAAEVDDVVDRLEQFQAAVRPGKGFDRAQTIRTLQDRPWRDCPCPICRRHRIEVALFRGNNRNRRRGFHNTFVFYTRLGEALQTAAAESLVPKAVQSQIGPFG